MTKSLTPVSRVPLGAKSIIENCHSVVTALLALLISLSSSSVFAAVGDSCSDLFQRQTIVLKDPSTMACIKAKFGCKPKSATVPVLNGKLSSAQYRIFFEDRRDYFWKLHQQLGIQAVIVVDPTNHDEIPSLLETLEGDQLLLLFRKIDEEAVDRSAIDRAPAENAIFIFYDQTGAEIARTEWIKGQRESVDASELYEPLNSRLQQLAGQISRVELIHSHPVHEIIIKTASESEPWLIVRHSLSQSDFHVAESMSRLLPRDIPFVISAAVPSGRRYSAIFVNGKNESRTWIQRTSEL